MLSDSATSTGRYRMQSWTISSRHLRPESPRSTSGRPPTPSASSTTPALPPDVEIRAGWDACMASVKRPAAQETIKALLEQGLQKPGDSENRLGFHVGQLRAER